MYDIQFSLKLDIFNIFIFIFIKTFFDIAVVDAVDKETGYYNDYYSGSGALLD